MKFLDIDGPLVQFFSKVADLMWLNILTILCCIPVVTVGASLTAMNYMAIKIVRNEEGYITKGFFKAFKENFKQSTIIWLIFVVVFGVIYVDYRIVLTTDIQINKVIKALIVLITGLAIFTFMYVFPLQSKFSNTVKKTIQNALFLSIMQWPKTILMILLYLVPYVLLYVFPGLIPVILIFCLSVPAILSARLNNKFFRKMEDQILSQNGGEAGEDRVDVPEPETVGAVSGEMPGEDVEAVSGEMTVEAVQTATDVSAEHGQND